MRSSAWVALAGLILAGSAARSQPAGADSCVACHGPGGNSATAAIPSIAGQPQVFLENQLVLIREGLRDVPAMTPVMTGLDDAAIIALARHFSTQPVAPATAPVLADRFSAGERLARAALCGTCHLPDYRGQGQVPRLAAQRDDYLAVTLKMYRDQPAPGRDTAMSGVLKGMSDADLTNLAHYFARLQP